MRDSGRLEAPWAAWAWFTLAAVGGSLVYGASLQLATNAFSDPLHSALRLTIAAGAGWIALGPALILFGRVHPLVGAHACLVAMTYGEAVLMVAAAANLGSLAVKAIGAFAIFNAGAVISANILMAVVLARQLRAAGTPLWITVVLWCLVLNGVGIVVFLTFPQLFPLP